MGIEFIATPNGMVVKQGFTSPRVYLDHWALMELSADAALGDRFISALKSAGGTLLIAHPNLIEFIVPTNPCHAIEAGRFLDRVVPNIFFADFNKSLDNMLTAPTEIYPDTELIRLVLINRVSLETLFKDMFAVRADLLQTLEEMKTTLVSIVEGGRNNERFRASARASRPTGSVSRLHLIARELLRDPFLSSRTFGRNDALDLQHAMVPACCCDYLLLDKAWVARVEAVRARLRKSGETIPLPKCFSKPGLESFLAELERSP